TQRSAADELKNTLAIAGLLMFFVLMYVLYAWVPYRVQYHNGASRIKYGSLLSEPYVGEQVKAIEPAYDRLALMLAGLPGLGVFVAWCLMAYGAAKNQQEQAARAAAASPPGAQQPPSAPPPQTSGNQGTT